ncbi:MAG: polyprenyl synthetase family protein [Prevotella sp.]|nr:polyprenyl synthetase family protein [Prevotella sp.]
MDYLSLIKQPIETELNDFIALFNQSLSYTDGLLESALSHIRNRGGKRMRPMLMLLMAKNYGGITEATLNAAVGLELLHTASLVHDDVVDESAERRGQQSVNATYDNKVAVLVGDYILSTALLSVSLTHNEKIVRRLAQLGQTLSNGEILQLTNTSCDGLSEDIYYQVIEQKTAALFEACCSIGAISAGKSDDELYAAIKFGQNVGIIFQIRDDIFDYFDSKEIGKPTGNDMAEGKLTLPAIYAINSTDNEEMKELARKVKARTINADEITRLVNFTKQNGGIEYAEQSMLALHAEAQQFIVSEVVDPEVAAAFQAYLDFVVQRNS